jgi:hypothetical protein
MGKTGQHPEGIAEDTQPGWFHMDGYPGISLDGRIIRWLGHVIIKPLLNQSEDRKLWRKRPLDYAFAAFKELLNSLKKTTLLVGFSLLYLGHLRNRNCLRVEKPLEKP